jgi:hypothetical protein
VKTTVLYSTLAANVVFATAAVAGGNAPAQIMPSYPYPSYCQPCWPQWAVSAQPQVIGPRPHVARHHSHANAGDRAAK